MSCYEQLRRGARYLDLRVGGKKGSTSIDDTIIVHGMLTGAPFPNIIEQIEQFLCDNSREFIVVEIIHDRNKHAMSNEQRLRILQLLSSTFGEKVTQEDVNSWFSLSKVTLGELGEKKRNILVLVNDGLYGSFSHEGEQYNQSTIARDFGCHNHAHFMKNKWHNTSSAHTLLRSNETFLEEGCNDCDKFVNSQFVMTPQPPGGFVDVVGLLLGIKSLRPVSLARELYQKDILETYLRDNAENSWNIILLDFVDQCPQLVRFLIGLNSPKQLKIKDASVASKDGSNSLDVTETISQMKKRNNCVYLLDFKDDLGVSVNEGTLKMTTQFHDEECVDHVIPFNRDTEYLLCDV